MIWWWCCKVGVCLPHFLRSVFFRLQCCLPVTSSLCAQFWPIRVSDSNAVEAKTGLGQMKMWYIFLIWVMECIWCMLLIKKKKTNEIKIFFIILFFMIYCNPFFCTDELCFEGACRKKWMKCGLLLSVLAWSRLLCTAHSPTHGPLCSVQLCEAPHSSLVPVWLKPRAYITETIWEHNCWITVFCVANI